MAKPVTSDDNARAIRAVLDRVDGSTARAAASLGVSKETLLRRMHEAGIQVSRGRPRKRLAF